MTEREHSTYRGVLLSRLEWSKVGDGEYLVEGHRVTRVKQRCWFIIPLGDKRGVIRFSMTDALEWVAEQLEERRG